MAGTRIGQRIGPFELAERLEAEGTLSLYRAIRPAGSREPRVVSIRLSEDPRDERSAAWVRNEYDTLRALAEPGHPSISRPYGYYASQVAVAMEDLPRVSLADALRLRSDGRIPLDAATAVDILIELAQCLRHAHGSTGPQGPIVHGHIGPEHVRLLPAGGIRLVGFGRPSGQRLPSYTAPEQAAGAFMDARTDQWSLGALGVEMLLGQALYAGAPDPVGLAMQGRVGPWLDRLERRWPEVCRVLARCLAPAAGDRYNREADLVRDLLTAARTIGGRADIPALASRVLVLLPARPEPLPSDSDTTPVVPAEEEPPGETTLVPSEDDVDPASVRSAALRPFEPAETDDDAATSHDPVWQTQQAWEQTQALPPSLAASSHPAAKRARAARLEEQRRASDPTLTPSESSEDEAPRADAAPQAGESAAPAPAPAKAEVLTEPHPAEAPEAQAGDGPLSDGETTAAGEVPSDSESEDGPTVGDPPPPVPDPAPSSGVETDGSVAEEDLGLELDQTEEAPRITLGDTPAGTQTSTGTEESADAPTDGPAEDSAETVATVVPEFVLEEDPVVPSSPPAAQPVAVGVEGLRWTEVLAVVMAAALFVSGFSFLIGLFR